jgi:hypothetical protein
MPAKTYPLDIRVESACEQQLYVGAKVAAFLKGSVGLPSQLLGVLLKALAGPL